MLIYQRVILKWAKLSVVPQVSWSSVSQGMKQVLGGSAQARPRKNSAPQVATLPEISRKDGDFFSPGMHFAEPFLAGKS